MPKKDIYDDIKLKNYSYLMDPAAADAEKTAKSPVESTISINELISFKNHPFEVNTTTEDFLTLCESIKEFGVVNPVLVRPLGDKYEILSGHRRVAACKEAGIDEVPVIIRELSDFEATIVMTHSNIYRPKIKVSEKAKAYRMCLDAEKHQGKAGIDTAAVIGGEEDSKRQVQRYVKLSYLKDEYLEMLDNGKMPLNVGVEIASLSIASQEVVLGYIDEYKFMPSIDQAIQLKEKYKSLPKGEEISPEAVAAILLSEMKPKVTKTVSFKNNEIKDFFPADATADYMKIVIIKLLEKYKKGEILKGKDSIKSSPFPKNE